MVAAAQRDHKFVADFAAQCSVLNEPSLILFGKFGFVLPTCNPDLSRL